MRFLFVSAIVFQISHSFMMFEPSLLEQKSRRSNALTATTKTYPYQYFDQLIDHFNPNGSDTFKQRYVVNEDYYDDSHMLIFYLNGEAAMSNGRASRGFYRVLAEEHKAYLVCLEHRYYGESNPTDDYSNDNLKYLLSDQALADAAYFLHWFISEEKKSDKIKDVVVVGGSYTGAMSAWFRMMFPNLVIGSIASSAPVYLEEEFVKYDQHLATAISNYSSTCQEQIVEAMDDFTNYIGNITENAENFQRLLNMTNCGALYNTSETNWNYPHIDFLYVLADSIAGAVQYNDYSQGDQSAIGLLCSTMNSTPADSGKYENITDNMLNFMTFLNKTLEASGTCLSFSTSYEKLKNTTIDPSESSRQWMYQSCQEFGYFQVASDNDSTRVRSKLIDLDYHENLCEALYNVTVDIEPKKLHYMQDDMIGTNIIWTNGDVDPWMELSITPVGGHTTSRQNVEVKQDGRVGRQHWKLLLISNGSHCSDISTPDDSTDSDSLKNAREEMRTEINYWVKFSTKGSDSYNTHSTLFLVSMVFYGLTAIFVILGIVFIVIACLKARSSCNTNQPINNSDSLAYGSM